MISLKDILNENFPGKGEVVSAKDIDSKMMDYFDKKDVTVIVKNLGIQSRTNQKKNPIWNLIIATMSSLNQLELESIKERTMAGRQVYVARGGVLGRKTGTTERGEFVAPIYGVSLAGV